jgi:class 3 adenylate cyclase
LVLYLPVLGGQSLVIPVSLRSGNPRRRTRSERLVSGVVGGRIVERRLAGILAADVAGYSRLMGVDEEGTLTQLKEHRQALVDPKIEEHRGRIVKTTGDGMLVEFASVVDAVRCAVEVQRGMSERNARVNLDKRIEFRVGINLGDIIIDDDDIYGEGVNIAARLEGIAEPGGICISRQAHDHLLEKLSFTCEKLGFRNLKNIAKPVEVYSVNFDSISMTQEIKYCRASDGVRLAYASVGQGPLIVKAANWMNHLRLGEPDLASFAGRIGEKSHAGSIRRTRQRAVGLGCR